MSSDIEIVVNERVCAGMQRQIPHLARLSQIGAVDRANLVLRIVGKGDKELLVPLPQPVLDELGHLWGRHHNRRWLFPSDIAGQTNLLALNVTIEAARRRGGQGLCRRGRRGENARRQHQEGDRGGGDPDPRQPGVVLATVKDKPSGRPQMGRP